MLPQETISFSKLFSSYYAATATFLSDMCCSCFWNISSETTPVNGHEAHTNQARWMSDFNDKRISFLSGLFGAFYEELHTDMLIKPNDHGPSKPAHMVLLATRSEIFKEMLEFEDSISNGKNGAQPSETIITIPELKSEELESLLEFLYTGNLPFQKLEKHVHSLFIASERYKIPYLQEFCQCYMLNSLAASNVVDVLETSEICSNKALKGIALNYIFNNAKDVVLSEKYEDLQAKYPQLCMQITRQFFMNFRNERPNRFGLRSHKKMVFHEKTSQGFSGKIVE